MTVAVGVPCCRSLHHLLMLLLMIGKLLACQVCSRILVHLIWIMTCHFAIDLLTKVVRVNAVMMASSLHRSEVLARSLRHRNANLLTIRRRRA